MKRIFRLSLQILAAASAVWLCVATVTFADSYFLRRGVSGIKGAAADLAECALNTVLGDDCKALAGQYVLSAAPTDCPYGSTLSGSCTAGAGDYVLASAPTSCDHDQILSGDCTAGSGDWVTAGAPATCPRPDSSCDGSSAAKVAESCDQLFFNGVTSDGLYWLQPRNNVAFQGYCDMEAGVGGWLLVVGIANSTSAHTSTGNVNGGNLTSPSGIGKYSDNFINKVKQKEYRLNCGGVTAYFPGSCTFVANGAPTGACEHADFSPGGTSGEGYYSVGTSAYTGGGTSGLEWHRSDGLGPTYGTGPGCGRHFVGGGFAGTLWVR